MELKVEDAKKELQGMVDDTKSQVQKEKDKVLPAEELKILEEKRQKDKEATENARVEAETKAKADALILTKKSEELSEDEKKRKAELEESKRKEEESKLSVEEKLKRVKDESQKRIDEVLNEMKQIKDKSSKEFEGLQKELQILKSQNEELSKRLSQSPAAKDETATELKKLEWERITKYLEEDKSLPREQRKEMSDEELEEWILEDLTHATVWINRREIRRVQETYQDRQELSTKTRAGEVIKKQQESLTRVLDKHKELNDVNSEKAKIFNQIINEDKQKFLMAENGPELVVEEMEKRLAISSQPSQTEEQKQIEALQKTVEELTNTIQAIQNPDDEGINSTILRKKSTSNELTEAEQILMDTMKDLPEINKQAALKSYRERIGKK